MKYDKTIKTNEVDNCEINISTNKVPRIILVTDDKKDFYSEVYLTPENAKNLIKCLTEALNSVNIELQKGMIKMKNKYLRLKLIAKKNQREKEIDRKEKADKMIKVLTDELSRVIIESR